MKQLLMLPLVAMMLVGTMTLQSCEEEIVQGELESNEWELTEAYSQVVIDSLGGLVESLADTDSVDLNTNLLPLFQGPDLGVKDTTWSYRVFLEDNGDAKGVYVYADTLQKTERGSWELRDPDNLYMNLGPFIDGVFTLERIEKNYFSLTSEANTGENPLSGGLITGDMELRLYMN
jgi:hypothetical protein